MPMKSSRILQNDIVHLVADNLVEIQRCSNDPAYFLATYGKILDPVRGPLPFNLYDYQISALHDFMGNQYNIVLKSRQMGFSWLVAGFVLYVGMFFSNKNIQMISIKESTAKRLLDKVKYIYDHLPEWMKIKIVDDNKTLITFEHGSRIESIPTSEDAGRSEGVTLLVIDEAAFVRWIDKVWQAAEPTLSTGGMCILLSTPNGASGFYHRTWVEAQANTNGFHHIFAPWWDNPVFGEGKREKVIKLPTGKFGKKWISPWYMDRMKKLGARRVAQEIDCEFLSSGSNYFDTSILMDRFNKVVNKNLVRYVTRWNAELRIYAHPQSDSIYVMGMDTATGHGSDYSCISIREFTTWKQVASYRTQMPVAEFASRAAELGRLYNNAFVVGEENGCSIATLLQMRDVHNYPDDMFFRDVDVDSQKSKEIFGWLNTQKSRRVYLNGYEKLVRENIKTFKDGRLLAELMAFIVKPSGRTEAADGYNDDMVFADLCAYIGLMNYQPCGALPFWVA